MSLAEIEEAVKELTPEELTKLRRVHRAPGQTRLGQPTGGRFLAGWKTRRHPREAGRRNRRGQFHIAPVTSHALPSFWKCYDQLPQHVQKLADKNFRLL
jgi:hypothetical protein